jgi:hypothetical protein
LGILFVKNKNPFAISKETHLKFFSLSLKVIKVSIFFPHGAKSLGSNQSLPTRSYSEDQCIYNFFENRISPLVKETDYLQKI